MAANIAFLAGENFAIADLSGSGVAFFGDAGAFSSVKVGFFQGRSFIANGNGTVVAQEIDNVKFLNAGSGIIGQTGSGVALTCIPNYQATLNLRFTYDSPVKTQNCEVRIYDRSDTNKGASGVTTKIAEIIHPGETQSNTGSGDTVWITPAGSSVVVSLCPSPGISGFYAGNAADGQWSDTQHDHYIAISASPDSIGAKAMFGLLYSLEFL